MKRFFNIIAAVLLYTSAYALPLHAGNNTIFEPDTIFETVKGGKATLSLRTTNAVSLQNSGIKGQLRSGKKLTAAIIDTSFYPEYTKDIKKMGLIHPAAFSEHLILDPDEDLEHLDIKSLHSQLSTLTAQVFPNREKANEAGKKIKDIRDLIERQMKYDKWVKANNKTHGSGVMEALHLIAPHAQLLPIDILGITKDMNGKTMSSKIAYSIRKAIQYNADVINISLKMDVTDEILDACKEATQKGIAIITAAGNDSSPSYKFTISELWDAAKKVIIRNPKQDLFEKLGGKGIRFAGALDYGPNGEEKVSSYTQHPSQNTEKHFIFASGSQLALHAEKNPDKLVNGTSFAGPTIAGGYLLLKQIALDNNLSLSTDQILDVMHESGRDVIFKGIMRFKERMYKSMDLSEAKKWIEEMVKAKDVLPTPIIKVSIVPATQPLIKEITLTAPQPIITQPSAPVFKALITPTASPSAPVESKSSPFVANTLPTPTAKPSASVTSKPSIPIVKTPVAPTAKPSASVTSKSSIPIVKTPVAPIAKPSAFVTSKPSIPIVKTPVAPPAKPSASVIAKGVIVKNAPAKIAVKPAGKLAPKFVAKTRASIKAAVAKTVPAKIAVKPAGKLVPKFVAKTHASVKAAAAKTVPAKITIKRTVKLAPKLTTKTHASVKAAAAKTVPAKITIKRTAKLAPKLTTKTHASAKRTGLTKKSN